MDDRDKNGKFIQGNQASKGKGRTPNSISINDELRKLLANKSKESKKKYVEIFAQKIFADALKGNDRLLVELWQQMEGRPNQRVEIEGGTDNTMTIIVEGVDISKFPKPNGS